MPIVSDLYNKVSYEDIVGPIATYLLKEKEF